MPRNRLGRAERGLSPEQRIAIAHAHFNEGLTQGSIASLLGVNPLRVQEACAAVMLAARAPVEMRRRMEAGPAAADETEAALEPQA